MCGSSRSRRPSNWASLENSKDWPSRRDFYEGRDFMNAWEGHGLGARRGLGVGPDCHRAWIHPGRWADVHSQVRYWGIRLRWLAPRDGGSHRRHQVLQGGRARRHDAKRYCDAPWTSWVRWLPLWAAISVARTNGPSRLTGCHRDQADRQADRCRRHQGRHRREGAREPGPADRAVPDRRRVHAE